MYARFNVDFPAPDEQISRLRQLTTEHRWEIDAWSDQMPRPPRVREPNEICVLVPYLKTVEDTFEGLWRAASLALPEVRRLSFLRSDSAHLRLAPGHTHTPGLCWERLRLDRSVGSPAVIAHQDAAHAGVLAMLALAPDWCVNGCDASVLHLWAAGYQVTLLGRDRSEAWRYRPLILLAALHGATSPLLDAFWDSSIVAGAVIPRVVECCR